MMRPNGAARTAYAGTLLSLARMAKGTAVSLNPRRTQGGGVLKKKILFGWLVVLVSNLWLSAEVQAIPPFARKYGTSCQTCHVMIPKLNSFGEAFRLNGYRIADADAALVKEEPAVLGAPAWKDMFPDAMWPSSIPGLPPVGFRIISHLQSSAEGGPRSATSRSRSNFEFPHELELLLGGRFDDHFGFFTEAEWKQGGGADIVQAYLVVNDFMSWANVPHHMLSGRIGIMDQQFLFGYSNPTRPSRSHPLWGNRKLSDWQLLQGTALTKSATGFRLQDNQPAIELNGIIARRLYWGAGVANGTGPTRFDVDTHKDFYYKLKYKPLGRDFLGKFVANEEVSMATKSSGGWVDNGLLLEHFGYFGAWTPDAAGAIKDRFWYLGGAARWTWEDLDLAGGYIHGHHDRPWGAITTQDTDVRTWFVKADYMLFPWLMAHAVYEDMNADEPSGTLGPVGPANFAAVGFNGSLDARRLLVGPIFAPRANITIALEAEIFLEHKGADLVSKDDPNNFWIRVDFAF